MEGVIWMFFLWSWSLERRFTVPNKTNYINKSKQWLLLHLSVFTFDHNTGNISGPLISDRNYYRLNTSRRQWRRPLVIALVPLKCSSRNLKFPPRVPFAKKKMHLGALALSKTKHTGLLIVFAKTSSGWSRICYLADTWSQHYVIDSWGFVDFQSENYNSVDCWRIHMRSIFDS